MQMLDKIANDLLDLDLDLLVENMTQFKEVVFTKSTYDDRSCYYDVITFANDKTGANRKHGVYIHNIIGVDGHKCMYVGKAERQTISARQTCHFTSFRNPWNTNERTGNKYREYMNTFNMDRFKIEVRYLDMTTYPKYMIPMFELMLMDHLQPILNQETFSL